MKHFVYIIYILTILCAGGWYIFEQKATIAEQGKSIQNLTVTQRPPVVPEKRKLKIVEKIVERKVTVKDKKCVQEYEKLKQQTLQCAYNLKFCQESSKIYGDITKDRPNGK